MKRARKEGGVPAGREMVPDDVRARVLAAAVRLIDQGGLASLSMREVARAAGVSHQAPYHYFPDRESILAALAREGFDKLQERLVRAYDPKAYPTEWLETAGRAYVDFACDHPSLFRVMFRPDFVAPERFPDLERCGDEAFAILPKVVRACIAEGLPEEPSERALIVFGWSLLHGLACLLLDGPLAKKLPDAAASKDELIGEVVSLFRLMIESRMKPRRKR